MSSTPFANIAITGGVLVALLLVAGVILILAGHDETGNNLVSIAIGAFAGTAATTGVVHQSNGFPAPDPPKVP